MVDEKYCSSCGNKLNSNSIFCDECGQRVSENGEDNVLICPYCQSSLQNNVAKCPNCGEWIDRSQRPHIQKINNFINLFDSNKKAINASKICIYITFIYAIFNRVIYTLFDSIIHEYFIFEDHIDSTIGLYVTSHYTFTQTHEMDGFSQAIYKIGTVLYGNFSGAYEYALSGGITSITDKIWLILFLISLITSILFIINKKTLKSCFYLVLTIISFLFMNYLLWYGGIIPFKLI